MTSLSTEREPVMAAEDERPALSRAQHFLENEQARCARLLGPDNETIVLPESVFRLLRQVVRLLAEEKAVAIVPLQKELTTQEAADVLGVSRPFLIKNLLETGLIPFTMTGSHRRLRFGDLMEYKRRRDVERREHLRLLTRMSEEFGDYLSTEPHS